MHEFSEFRETANRAVYGKLFRRALAAKGGCHWCRFHRCDNAFGSRRPRGDKHKNHRR